MLEFQKLCETCEQFSAAERGRLLTEKSASVLNRLHSLALPGIDPVEILAGFLVGAAAADGKISETEYLLIYPALLRTFGDEVDFSTLKELFRRDGDGKKFLAVYTEEMLQLFHLFDDSLKEDLLLLCLCVTSVDRKISLKEKRYLKKLCEG